MSPAASNAQLLFSHLDYTKNKWRISWNDIWFRAYCFLRIGYEGYTISSPPVPRLNSNLENKKIEDTQLNLGCQWWYLFKCWQPVDSCLNMARFSIRSSKVRPIRFHYFMPRWLVDFMAMIQWLTIQLSGQFLSDQKKQKNKKSNLFHHLHCVGIVNSILFLGLCDQVYVLGLTNATTWIALTCTRLSLSISS